MEAEFDIGYNNKKLESSKKIPMGRDICFKLMSINKEILDRTSIQKAKKNKK